MEYIPKQETQPERWDEWFTTATGRRSFDYNADYSSLTNLQRAKSFLLSEQHFLCAYCQQKLTQETASIEHVIPKEHNSELSTNYYNLVVVCKLPKQDPGTRRLHCDKEKESKIITSLLFVGSNAATKTHNNAWFDAYADGTIVAKNNLGPEHRKQAEAFIETLNLNHSLLRNARAQDSLNPYIEASQNIQGPQLRRYWINVYGQILQNLEKPYRQFLLIYIGRKLGLN